MKQVCRSLTTIVCLIVAVGLLLPADTAASTFSDARFSDGLVVDNVPSPTAIDWLPDGTILVTTQGGTLYRQNAAAAAVALDLTSVTCAGGETGLLGVAVDPNFGTGDRFVYLYYTHKQGSDCSAANRANRVSRFTIDGSGNAGNEQVLIDHIPAPGGNHNAGDLHFGRDGLLYISVGDGGQDLQTGGGGAQNANARRLDLLNGKILRIAPDGSIPTDNPFLGAGTTRCASTGQAQSGVRHAASPSTKAQSKHSHKHQHQHQRKQKKRHRHKRRGQDQNPPDQTNPNPNPNPDPNPSGTICQEIYATGLRNPFRIAFDPNNTSGPQRFYINDVGQSSWEEIDDGRAGADYGWNLREGPCPTGTTTGCSPDSRFSEPVFAYDRSAGCVTITGGAFVPNTAGWPPEFNGTYLFADFGCDIIFALRNETVGQVHDTFAMGTQATSLKFGPDNALYYTTFDGGGEVHCIVFTP